MALRAATATARPPNQRRARLTGGTRGEPRRARRFQRQSRIDRRLLRPRGPQPVRPPGQALDDGPRRRRRPPLAQVGWAGVSDADQCDLARGDVVGGGLGRGLWHLHPELIVRRLAHEWIAELQIAGLIELTNPLHECREILILIR